jgi:hypothetical protein
MACLLRAGLGASMAGHAGAVLAGLGMLHRGAGPAHAVALGAWALLIYLQLRVHLDAELFQWLAEGGSMEELDTFLERTGLRKRSGERSADERLRGALGLWRQLLAVLVIELAAAAIGLR